MTGPTPPGARRPTGRLHSPSSGEPGLLLHVYVTCEPPRLLETVTLLCNCNSFCTREMDESRSGALVAQSRQTLCSPWTVAPQAPLSVEFSRQEYWRGLPFPPPGHLPGPGIEPGFPTLQADSLPTELLAKHSHQSQSQVHTAPCHRRWPANSTRVRSSVAAAVDLPHPLKGPQGAEQKARSPDRYFQEPILSESQFPHLLLPRKALKPFMVITVPRD